MVHMEHYVEKVTDIMVHMEQYMVKTLWYTWNNRLVIKDVAERGANVNLG